MDPNTYQDAIKTTEIYSEAARNFTSRVVLAHESSFQKELEEVETLLNLMYCAGKLNGEAGEIAEEVFKMFRGGAIDQDRISKLFYELGDCLWYIARLADLAGFRLSDVMLSNIEKLQTRQREGTIHGYGSDR